MYSKEAFAKLRLKDLVRDHIPFKAYWHSRGYGVILLNNIPQRNGQPAKRPLQSWDRQIARMRKDCWLVADLTVIEYDGETIREIEGSGLECWI